MYVAALGRLLDRAPATTGAGIALALALTGTAALLRLGFQAVAPEALPFSTFYVSTLAAALLAGLVPALVAMAGATLAGWWLFLPPPGRLVMSTGALVSLVLFVATQAAVVALALALRGTVGRLRRAQATLAESDALLRAVFEQLPAAAFVVEAGSR
ncbi:DUF4118 domain-containing protein, partial [Falsiroseomonas oryzae]|uniref:DUF4118 domain-containing protein n=1 Tax=Falsiroseomonas oryzae TaxID=2766473 RepID=UPI0022EB4224